MKIRERNVVRSFQKLRRHQSNGRILNMIDYTTASEKRWRGRPAAEGTAERRVLFSTPALNNVIFVKHNLRRNEREIFPSGVQVATKIFVPFDTKRLEVGGRSFFIEEPNYNELLKEFFQMDPSRPTPQSSPTSASLKCCRRPQRLIHLSFARDCGPRASKPIRSSSAAAMR